MKARSKNTAGFGDESRPYMRFHVPANGQHPHSASGQPMPTALAQPEFTIEEHLRVQREIEARAHQFWLAQGCALKSALNCWRKAEDEVLAEFVKKRLQCHPRPTTVRGAHTKTGGTCSSRTATIHPSPAP
jgi:hypothetical protein